MSKVEIEPRSVDGVVVEQTGQSPDCDGKATAAPRERSGAATTVDPLAAAGARCRSWGWPISITGSCVLLTTDSLVSAVELPCGLAADVQRFLAMRLLAGPVVALPGAPRRRILLATSAVEVSEVVIDRLGERGAITHRAGTLVPLPPSRLACGQVSWQVQPALVDPWLPPWTAIAAAVRSITTYPSGTP